MSMCCASRTAPTFTAAHDRDDVRPKRRGGRHSQHGPIAALHGVQAEPSAQLLTLPPGQNLAQERVLLVRGEHVHPRRERFSVLTRSAYQGRVHLPTLR